MLNFTAVNNSEDLSLISKPVDLQAQCNEERAESLLTDELIIINTFRKRRENEIMNISAQHSKRAWCLPQSNVFNAENICPVWCHDDILLPAHVQQTHCHEHVIWETLSHMLSDTAHCDSCRRAEVNQCFIAQTNSVCAHCTSLCNSHSQCMTESLIITTLNSERSDVVVLHAHACDNKRDDSTL